MLRPKIRFLNILISNLQDLKIQLIRSQIPTFNSENPTCRFENPIYMILSTKLKYLKIQLHTS